MNIFCCGLLISLAWILHGCNEAAQTDATTPSRKPKLDQDSLLAVDYWEQAEAEKVAQRDSFHVTMSKKAFHFVCYDKCEDGEYLFPADLKKHRLQNLYNIHQQRTRDSLTVKFSFNDDCCLEHVADLNLRDDTLRLLYKDISHQPCDCWCGYHYQFSIPLHKYPHKVLLLGDSVLTRRR